MKIYKIYKKNAEDFYKILYCYGCTMIQINDQDP